MDIQNTLDGITSALKKAESMLEPAFYAGGFVWGATEGQSATFSKLPLEKQISARLAQTLTNLGIGGVPTGNGYVSQAGQFKFKPTGFLNKGLAAAVGAWLYKEAKLPYAKEIYDAVYPFGVGYSAGGFFDPQGAGIMSRSYSSGQAFSTSKEQSALSYNKMAGIIQP